MKRYPTKAFTIIELLVVVSIIALLVGILLPAIGKAREQANLTRSQSNLSQLAKATQTYSAEYKDRQLTYCNDNLARYALNSNDPAAAVINYATVNGYEHPAPVFGISTSGGIVGYWMPPSSAGNPLNGHRIVPINFEGNATYVKRGAFQLIQCRQLSQYMNGRFYDPVFYAPKDTGVWSSVEANFDRPHEYYPDPEGLKLSSYCYSAAAMFNPDVLSRTGGPGGVYYQNPWSVPAGFRSPSMSQATFPDLKTQIIEHHWLQGSRRKTCNPYFTGGVYSGCQPFYYNASIESNPVCLFFDGHVGSLSVLDAMESCKRVNAQVTGNSSGNAGTWSKDTPLGGDYEDGATNGYWMGNGGPGFDWACTSFHILTRDGIKGRDIVSK
jgi:prepilin-type N-terminal cleavage/methylation domain-containing protein